MNLTLKSDTGREAQVETGFSWTALFFGGFPFFFRGLHLYGGLWLGGVIILVATVNALDRDGGSFVILGNIVMAVVMNKLTVRHYLKNGYKPVGEGWDIATEKLRIGAGTYTLIVFLGMSSINIPSETEKRRSAASTDVPTFEDTEKAAKQGDTEAMLSLGYSYYKQGDVASAVPWYVKAAERGNAMAAMGLGLMYSQGRGTPKDICAAKRWYEKADELGNNWAKLGLVSLYHPDNGDAPYRCK